MSPIHRLVSGILLFAASLVVSAAHITDKLVVGLYSTPANDGSPVTLLSSGTPLEVLERGRGFVRVRLADASEGWVESDYVTDEKPARAMLLETQARLRQMGLELAALRERQDGATSGVGEDAAAAAPPGAREARLRAELDQADERIAALERRLAALSDSGEVQRQLAELQAQVGRATRLLAEAQGLEVHRAAPSAGIDAYLPWIIGLIAFVCGIGAGVAYVDYRIRRRHGGLRL